MKHFFSLICVCLMSYFSCAQTNPTNAVLNSAITPGNYTNQQRITLSPGMNATGANGAYDLYIDPSISLGSNFPAAGAFGTSPVSYNLDLSKPVGTIPFSFNLSTVGSAQCNVPIDCPLGTNNMKPKLSFQYNSLSGNGELGSGWSIGGLERISRLGGSIYHNGDISGVELTNNDNFALNGNRLLVTTGSNGGHSSVYTTEQNVFSRITSYGTVGNGPGYFKVETKEGLILEYGNSSASQLIPVNQSTVFEWYLNKITDQSGNYIVYDYYNSNGEVLIKEVKYTGNSLNPPYNSVNFYYNQKQEKNTRFVYGGEISERSILRMVEVKQDNNFVSQYTFSYVSYFNNSYLTEINLKTRDYKDLNGLKFSYQNDNGNPTSQVTSGLAANPYHTKYLLLDFTGDGKKDAVAFDALSFNGNYVMSYQWTNWRALQNNGSSVFTQISSNSFPGGFNPVSSFMSMSTKGSVGNFVYSAYDFNGDNKEDFVLQSTSTSYDNFNVYISNGTGFNTPVNFSVFKNSQSTSDPNKYWFTDLDGDGKLDLLYTDNIYNNPYMLYPPGDYLLQTFLNIGSTGGILSPVTNVWVHGQNAGSGKNLDINGDGKTELLIPNLAGNAYSLLSSGTGGWLSMNPIPASNAFNSIDHPNYQVYSGTYQSYGSVSIGLEGDFNGDGKSDFITSSSAGTMPVTYKFEMFLGKGDGTFTSAILLNKTSLGLHDFTQAGYFYFTNDMNGDGKTDIIERSSSGIKIYYSKGNDGGDYFFSETYSSFYIYPRDFDVADIDGDGVNDIFNYDSGTPNSTPNVIYFYKGAISKNIKEIVDGFGKKIEVLSAPISDASVYSQPTLVNNPVYPVSVLNAPFYVVKEVKTSNGIGGTNTDTYQYENALVHKNGKGLLCFSKITKSSVSTDSKIVDEYSYDPTKFNPYLVKTSNYALGLNQLITDKVYANVNFTYGSLSYFPFVNSTTETNHLLNSTTYVQNTPDVNGNITYTDRNINNGLDHEQTYYSGFVSNGSWMLSKPTTLTKYFTRSGQQAQVGNVAFTYDSFGHIQTITEEPGDPKMVVKSYSYDSNTGVLLSYNISAPNSALPVKTTSYNYDSKYRLVTQETNPSNQIAQTKYDFIWGKPIEFTDFNGLKTTYTYDGLGRVLTTKLPDNNITTCSYDWVTSNDFVGGDPLNTSVCLYKIMTTSPGNPSKGSYYDMFDREIRKETEGFSGDKHYSMIEFDAQSRKKYETGMYQLIQNNSFSLVKTSYTYDYLNRLITENMSDGTNSKSYSYTYSYPSGTFKVTTTHPDGKISSKTEDASGLIIAASDNGGNIGYVYYSNRKTKTISVNNVQVNYMEYDNFSRQTKLQDKDAGITLYDYNAYGEIASQTDANNKTYHYSYDELGRITTKMGPDGTYSYQYVTSGSGLNQLLQETAGNGYYTKYYYDQYGRMNKVEENIAGQTYSTRYNFDQYGRIEKIIYPSNFATKNIYNSHGHLSQIFNDVTNQAIWTCNATNPLGKTSNYTSGNGKTTQVDFNNFGFLSQVVTPNVQSVNYNFNILNSNLSSRTDNLLVKTESFIYDNLDRLTTVQISGLSNFNVTYNNSGNVLTKSGLGNLTYKSSKPDAVNNVDNTNGIINTSVLPGNAPNIQNLNYTAFNKIQNIFENNYQYDVFYGCDQLRRKADLYINSTLDNTRIYVGDYEKTIQGANNQEVHYINSPSGLCAIYVITNGTGVMYYPYEDHLGSIVKATDAGGTIVADLNYDAWGRMRNSLTWDYTNPSTPPTWLYRGYTGHEHLTQFALINMNGRLYDPVLGQMLSPDNFNQNSAFTQNYNRYAYAYNNPLKYKDPSGNLFGIDDYIAGIIVGAVIGGIVNVAVHWEKIHSFQDGLVAFGIGAAAGAMVAATFGAGIAVMGGAAATIGAAALAGGVSAVAGEAILNTGNAIYFHDRMNDASDYGRAFAYGFVTAGVMKGVSDAVTPKVKLYPDRLEPKGPGQLPVESAEREIIPQRIMPEAAPAENLPVPDENLTLVKVRGVDGAESWYTTTGPNGRIISAPDGTNIKIPANYYQAPANNGSGIVYRPVGSPINSNANSIRIMGPTAKYPNGYYRIYGGDKGLQPLDIYGNPGDPNSTHIPFK